MPYLDNREATRREQARLAAYRAEIARMGHVTSRGAALCRTSAGTTTGSESQSSVKVQLLSGGRSRTSGVQHCGSSWACPYCAPNVAEVRAGEIAAAIRAAHAAGLVAFFVTMTMAHTPGDDLATIFDAVRDCWSRTWGGRAAMAWRKDKKHRGTIRTVEVTAGQTGWHPHVHAVVFFEPGVSVHQVWGWLHQQWSHEAGKVGRKVSQTTHVDRHGRTRYAGVDVQPVDVGREQDCGDYLAKWGVSRELSSTWAKSGGPDGRYSPLGLLLAASTRREPWAFHRWVEYENTVAGRHSVRWSPKLKSWLRDQPTTSDADALVLGVELSDEEAAADREVGEVEDEMIFEPSVWNRMVRQGRAWEPVAIMRHRAYRREYDHLVQFMSGAPPG